MGRRAETFVARTSMVDGASRVSWFTRVKPGGRALVEERRFSAASRPSRLGLLPPCDVPCGLSPRSAIGGPLVTYFHNFSRFHISSSRWRRDKECNRVQATNLRLSKNDCAPVPVLITWFAAGRCFGQCGFPLAIALCWSSLDPKNHPRTVCVIPHAPR